MLITPSNYFVDRNRILKKTIYNFKFCVLAIALLSVSCVFLKTGFAIGNNYPEGASWSPIWLLFGPVVYFANAALNQQHAKITQVLSHFLPFAIALVYSWVIIGSGNHPNALAMIEAYEIMNILVPFSLVCYALYVMAQQQIKTHSIYKLLYVICGFFLLIAATQVLIYISITILQLHTFIDYRLITFAFLLMMALFIATYLSVRNAKLATLEQLNVVVKASYENSTLHQDKAHQYKNKICTYFETEKPYLRSDISVDLLERELGIPKHLFSQIFNRYMGVSFYRFVANYRIEYALELIKAGEDKVTIEYIAYQCGFNSKTSFNKYFKDITGMSPFEYINQ